jgi:hypothetical protein
MRKCLALGAERGGAPLRYDQPPWETLGIIAGYLPKLVGLKSGLPKGSGLPLENQLVLHTSYNR